MNKISRMFLKDKGLTLVEVLASIVILTIILIIFLSVFIQSAKTNQSSEEKLDATFIAQTEMEHFYEYSKSINESDRITKLQKEGYTFYFTENKEIFIKNDSKFYVQITLSEKDNLTNILVEVFDSPVDKKRIAQMQNILEWRTNDEG